MSEMRPLVSVLIPCFNAGPWLEETLRSVMAQTWEPIETIVVDDGSSDDSVAIAERFRSDKLRIVTQENKGQSAAENRAMAEARGDYFEFLDADDLLAPDKIERQIRLAQSIGDSYVISGEWARFREDPAEASFETNLLWKDLEPIEWLLLAWSHHLMMHGAAWLIPRRIAEQAGPWDQRLSLINDFDYFSRVLLASDGVRFCPQARSYYRSGNSGSLSGAKSRRAWESAFLSLTLGTDNLLARDSSERARAVCATVFQRYAYEVYAQQRDLSAKAASRALELGGSDLKAEGSPLFNALTRVVGWKLASQIRQRLYNIGYTKVALGRYFDRQPAGHHETQS